MTVPPSSVLIGLVVFLLRSSLSGVILGGVATLASLHLWPELMQLPYQWVGEGLRSLGLL